MSVVRYNRLKECLMDEVVEIIVDINRPCQVSLRESTKIDEEQSQV